MSEGNGIAEIFDTREDGLKCVRFESGEVGVVDVHGKVLFAKRNFKHATFAAHDFVKLRSSRPVVMNNPELRYMLRDEDCSCIHIFYVDLKSGQLFGSMPKLHRYGNFEVLFIREHMFTRTKPCYSSDTHPSFVRSSRNGLYLEFVADDGTEKDVFQKLLYKQPLYNKCLIKGDEERTYWLEVKFEDESVVVMDDEGMHYYVRLDKKTGKVVWRELGSTSNSAEKSVVNMVVNDIKVEVRNRMQRDKEEEQKAAARYRQKRLDDMTGGVPFQIGGKWGLKQNGRIVVPATYRTIQAPVGKYCAVEKYPGIWGVIAVDGKVEIEAKYEGVEIRPDGTVELTVGKGKIKKLKIKKLKILKGKD